MDERQAITVVILTHNEERHLARALGSVTPFARRALNRCRCRAQDCIEGLIRFAYANPTSMAPNCFVLMERSDAPALTGSARAPEPARAMSDG